ncbi:uncharacterized protein LDX57_008288 [Aspergillus melleus]|uniref:uncharacterized protein n=1 Tax=Aspergillus melleus TaxID=138277 RepID=UPI001E8D3FF7|nr:uncharacterized protein LDX57_008288 [Aspergillus melleus]KAH8430625.1 hypothetical protein LDX57_008288 [Aspergillus melleus]
MSDSSATDLAATIIAAAALSISSIALLIAIGQITQQYISTAEGYRRCQSPVMGAWAQGTRKRFIPREVRFQTVYQSPHLSLESPTGLPEGKYFVGSDKLPNQQRYLEYRKSHKWRFLLDRRHDSSPPSLRASWLGLLEQLRVYQGAVYGSLASQKLGLGNEKKGTADVEARIWDLSSSNLNAWFTALKTDSQSEWMTLPAVEVTEFAWDFMPPEALRPFASISLGDLLAIGHRIGLDWTAVDPLQGILQAQDDNGNIISSSDIRGLGTLITFFHDERDRGNQSAYTNAFMPIPTTAADKLAFGIIPGDQRLGLNDVLATTDSDCLDYIASLDPEARRIMNNSFKTPDPHKTGFDQLMSLISPCLLLPNCRLIRVRLPHRTAVYGALYVMEAYVVFRERVKEIIASTSISAASPDLQDNAKWIWDRWQEIANEIHGAFEPAIIVEKADPVILAATMSRVHNQCTARLEVWTKTFLQDIDDVLEQVESNYRPSPDRQPVRELVRVHMLQANKIWGSATDHIAQGKAAKMYGLEKMGWPEGPIYCQMINHQLDNAPPIAKEVVRRVISPSRIHQIETSPLRPKIQDFEESVKAAWYILNFRALIFNRSHIFQNPARAGGRPYKLIPAEWCNSKMPIYIG